MPDFNDTTIAQTFPYNAPRHARPIRGSDPNDSLENVYIHRSRRTDIVDDYHLPPLPGYHKYEARSPLRESRSVTPPRRHVVRWDDHSGRRSSKYYDSESDSDSDSDARDRRVVRRRKSDKQLQRKIVPCGELCDDHPHHKNKAKDRDASDDDEDGYLSSGAERERQDKIRKRKALYTGLACVATVAAANNIYQNTKAHHVRKNHLREGEMCTAEAKRLRTKARMMDLLSLGIVAVGINNVRVGWNRANSIK